jgi:hypothetical protein
VEKDITKMEFKTDESTFYSLSLYSESESEKLLIQQRGHNQVGETITLDLQVGERIVAT